MTESSNNNSVNIQNPKIMPLTNGPYYLINDMEAKIVEYLMNSKLGINFKDGLLKTHRGKY
jgi:hypothetical protein